MTNRRNLFRAAGALAGAAFIPAAHAASPKHPSGMNGVRTLKGGRIKRIEPFKRDLAPSLRLQAFAQQPYNHARIRHPMVRKSWLEKGHRAGGEGRESDPFVRVSWEKAAKLVAGELKRVRETYDPGAIWGGSYGWMRTSSVGNARNLL